MSIQSEPRERPLRADAERNRTKILAAAAQVFAEKGLEATLDEVAAAAGVGVGTIYRRFPDKEALIGALFDNAVDEIANLASAASARDNSWEALVWFLEEALQRQCANRGLREVVVESTYAADRIEAAKCRITPAIGVLVERAQRDGYLRADVVSADFPIMEMMISFLGNITAAVAPDLWRRYLTILLDGLMTSRDGTSPLYEIPGDTLMSEALRSAHRHAHRG
ncbi:MAG: helix-turn-helix domain containing protein [Actinomycetota bacterium]|jgi:AcrR family transcriptional regulator|nr:helix-turn-helix domain containing protein [Actinomycetota bacterium]